MWSKAFGDASQQNGRGVATDSAGNVVLTGFFWQNVNFGDKDLISKGPNDVFVVKLDASGGDHLWSKSFGGGTFDEGASVAIDSADNVLLTGFFAGTVDFVGEPISSSAEDDKNVFVAKLSASGDPLWIKGFGGDHAQEGTSVAADSEGNIVLTGYFEGTVDFEGSQLPSAGDRDIFVAKLDTNGTRLWSKRFVYPGVQEGTSVATDSAGNVVLTGSFMGDVNFGDKKLTSEGDSDIFVAKFDASGKCLWSMQGLLSCRATPSPSRRRPFSRWTFPTKRPGAALLVEQST